jgi:hypothetical protein
VGEPTRPATAPPTDTDAQPPPPERRVLGIALAVLALGALGFVAQSRQWLTSPGYSRDIGFGLIDDYACSDFTHSCEDMDNDALVDRYNQHVDAPRHFPESGSAVVDAEPQTPWDEALPKPGLNDHASAAFAPAGYVTFSLIGIAALALVIAGLIAAARRRPQLPVSPCTIAVVALGLDLLCGLTFVATKPGPTSMVGVGPAFWIFGGGVLLGTAGALLLARVIRPVDPDLLEDAIDPEDY